MVSNRRSRQISRHPHDGFLSNEVCDVRQQQIPDRPDHRRQPRNWTRYGPAPRQARRSFNFHLPCKSCRGRQGERARGGSRGACDRPPARHRKSRIIRRFHPAREGGADRNGRGALRLSCQQCRHILQRDLHERHGSRAGRAIRRPFQGRVPAVAEAPAAHQRWRPDREHLVRARPLRLSGTRRVRSDEGGRRGPDPLHGARAGTTQDYSQRRGAGGDRDRLQRRRRARQSGRE